MQNKTGRRGLRQRLFAWWYAVNKESSVNRLNDDYKRDVFAGLHGDVLEIGPGTGDNLRFFSGAMADQLRWIGIEPNVYMQAHLQAALDESGVQGEIRTGTAEQTGMPDASVDGVISTFVLCSVTDVDAALAEVLRVLRPGGRFVFVEHVAAPENTPLRRRQQFIKPLWKIIADGCHPDRELEAAVQRAGFSEVQVRPYEIPEAIVSPRIAGIAIK